MRLKLEKWQVPLFPRLRAQRGVAMLRRLPTLVPPRVVAAVLRTLWSGWCTARRFGQTGPCLFCGAHGGDSVEHASVCKALACFGQDHLRLPYTYDVGQRRMSFLLLEHASLLWDGRLALGALRLAAAYRLHCTFRRRPWALTGAEVVRRALEQNVRALVQGHTVATGYLDGRWAA